MPQLADRAEATVAAMMGFFSVLAAGIIYGALHLLIRMPLRAILRNPFDERDH